MKNSKNDITRHKQKDARNKKEFENKFEYKKSNASGKKNERAKKNDEVKTKDKKTSSTIWNPEVKEDTKKVYSWKTEAKKDTKKVHNRKIETKEDTKKAHNWKTETKEDTKKAHNMKNEEIKENKRTNERKRRGKENDGNCPVAKDCGGCHYQGISYEKQLSLKQKKVKELLGKYGDLKPIIGMKNPYHYRNKVHAVFGRLRNGTIISGVYKEKTHHIVSIDSCQIENPKADAIIYDIRNLLKSFKIKTYDEDNGYGLLRHVLVRTGYQSGEIMVVLVLGSPILPSKNNFVAALRKLHKEITTIVINVNNKNTSMVLGDKQTTIYGKGYIEDTLCGCVFRISPKSFYQVNPVQTEILYQHAFLMAGLTGKERVVDAYCGIGTIGLIASKKAKEVIAVELNKDAVKDANINAKRNEIKNIRFYQADAGAFMTQMADVREKADVIFMDPPRSGSSAAFLCSLVKLAPKKVIYISCNPETQARDLEYLTKNGYEVKGIQPVDMFPMTNHVETAVLLVRKG